jgi:hypothetical protein
LEKLKNITTVLTKNHLLKNEEYICKVAENVEGAKDLIEVSFEYVTDMNGLKLFRKLKTSYLGSPVLP